MKKYTYEARDSANNKIVKSTVQAESENAAAKLLTEQGFAPLKIELQDEKAGFFARWSIRLTRKDRSTLLLLKIRLSLLTSRKNR